MSSISFPSVPTSLRVPLVTAEFTTGRAAQGLALLAYRALLIGQKTSGGSWTANTLQKVTNVEQVILGAGRGSMLHRQAAKWFANNRSTELWIGVLADNGAGAQATGTFTVTGPATATGTLHLYLGGNYIPVGVTSGDAQNTIAAAINTAINAALDLPVTSTVSTNVVTVTFRHKGTCGNDFDMRLNYQDGQATPAGVAVAVVAMSGGTTNPVLTSLITAMGDQWFNVLAHPYTDSTSLTAIEGELSARFGPMRMIDGVAITSAVGTQGALSSLGSGRNSPHSVIASQPGKNPLTPPMEFAAAVAAVTAYYAQIDPARPFQTLPLVGMLPPAQVDQFTNTDRNLNLYDGISTSKVDAGGVVRIERLITTYEVAASGADDESYLRAETMFTLMYLRYSWRVRIANKYPRHKLANDGTRVGPGQPVMTPKIGKGEALGWFRELEDLGLVEGFDQFARDLVVERDATNPDRMNWLFAPDLINQFVVGAARIDFLL
jgi:phage tail sheath gpL-like